MNGKSDPNDNVVTGNDDDGDDGSVVLPQQKGGKTSSCSPYWIEVCQGPDCTGLGGGIAVLEIEELVREHHHQIHHTDRSGNRNSRIRVVAGGCRDFCSVGPNVHVLVRQKKQGGNGKRKTSTSMLESFQNVKDVSSCDRVANVAIAYASVDVASGGNGSAAQDSCHPDTTHDHDLPQASSSTSTSRHRSMMARKAERTRWEALKDVSRTIAKCKKVVGVSNRGSGSGNIDGIDRKLRIWKETCQDRIARATTTSRPLQRDQRRTERLIEIASEKLDRICLQFDDESDSNSSSSGSSSDLSDTDDE